MILYSDKSPAVIFCLSGNALTIFPNFIQMIGLTAGIMMFFSAIPTADAASVVPAPIAIIQAATTTAAIAPTMEQIVRTYFTDTPILAEVARCESTFAQFDKNGAIK